MEYNVITKTFPLWFGRRPNDLETGRIFFYFFVTFLPEAVLSAMPSFIFCSPFVCLPLNRKSEKFDAPEVRVLTTVRYVLPSD